MANRKGWYVDWIDPTQERFFTGRAWEPATRPRTPEAIELPTNFDPSTAAKSMRSESGDTGAIATFVYLIAGVIALGALIGGIALITHSHCGLNPYDPSLTDCSQKSHPFAGTGAAVLIGGLLQAFVVAVVGRLCTVVSEQRAAIAALSGR